MSGVLNLDSTRFLRPRIMTFRLAQTVYRAICIAAAISNSCVLSDISEKLNQICAVSPAVTS
jgi:hypothetical protein